MLAVKASSFNSSREIEDFNGNIEVVSCEIITNSNLKYAICCCYRPPNVDSSWLEEFNSFLVQLTFRYRNIIIRGDFNFPKISWYEHASVTGSNETEFIEELNDFYFTQVNTSHTRGEHILDLIISNAPDQILNITTLNPIDSGLFTDYYAIEFILTKHPSKWLRQLTALSLIIVERTWMVYAQHWMEQIFQIALNLMTSMIVG